MNFGALNTFVLNGGVPDPVVRTGANGQAFAIGSVQLRVFVFTALVSSQQALHSGALARVFASLGVDAVVSAVQTAAAYRVVKRFVVSAYARANATTVSQFVRIHVVAYASASAVIELGSLALAGVSGVVAATSTYVSRLMSKAAVSSVAKAASTPLLRVFGRAYYAPQIASSVSAVSDLAAGVLVKTCVSGSASAGVEASVGVVSTMPVSASAYAVCTVDFESYKRAPWDEYAPQDRSFKVNPTGFVFKVLS